MADGDNVQEIVEGKAKVLLPKSVFYNPVQEFNRDLTACIISQFAEEHEEQACLLYTSDAADD